MYITKKNLLSFFISKLVEFSFKNWNLHGLEWWYRSDEAGRCKSDSVGLPIVWQFIDCMDSPTTFTKYFQNGITCMWIILHVCLCVGIFEVDVVCFCDTIFIIYPFCSCLLWVLNVCEIYLTSHLCVLCLGWMSPL